MYVTIATGLVGLIVILGVALCRNKSPMNLLLITFLFAAASSLYFPIMSLVVDPVTWRNLSGLDMRTIGLVQLNYAAFLFGLLLAMIAGSAVCSVVEHEGSRESARPVSARGRDTFVSMSLCLIGSALYLLYVSIVGLDALLGIGGFTEKYQRSQGLGPLYMGLTLVCLGCLWAETAQLRYRNIFRLLAVVVILWSAIGLSMRLYAATLVAGYLWVYCYHNDVRVRQLNWKLVSFVFLFWVLLEFFSVARSAGPIFLALVGMGTSLNLESAALGASVGGSELSHAFITFAELHRDHSPGELRGSGYSEQALTLFPLALWPDRPPTMAEWFVATHYGEFALQGGGTGFSLVGEAWLNFGAFLGPLLLGTMVGIVLWGVEKWAFLKRSGLAARILPYLVVTIVMGQRSAAASIVKEVLTVVVPSLVLVALYHLFVNGLKQRRLTGPVSVQAHTGTAQELSTALPPDDSG